MDTGSWWSSPAGVLASLEQGGNVLLLNPRLPREQTVRWQALWEDLVVPRFRGHLGLLTSGTGGSGSLVLLSLAALRCSAAAVNRHLGATSADTSLNVLPLFHVGGLGVHLRAAALGARVVELPAGWSPAACIETVMREEVSLLSLVPTQLYDLIAAGHPAPDTLRAVVIGGARLEAELRIRARDLGWPVLPSYGLTECASQVATASVSSLREEGRDPDLLLLDHVDARIDPAGRIVIRSGARCTAVLHDLRGEGRLTFPAPDDWFTTADPVSYTHLTLPTKA